MHNTHHRREDSNRDATAPVPAPPPNRRAATPDSPCPPLSRIVTRHSVEGNIPDAPPQKSDPAKASIAPQRGCRHGSTGRLRVRFGLVTAHRHPGPKKSCPPTSATWTWTTKRLRVRHEGGDTGSRAAPATCRVVPRSLTLPLVDSPRCSTGVCSTSACSAGDAHVIADVAGWYG